MGSVRLYGTFSPRRFSPTQNQHLKVGGSTGMFLITSCWFLLCRRVRWVLAGAFDAAFFDVRTLGAIFFFGEMIGQSWVVCVVFKSVIGKAKSDIMNDRIVADVWVEDTSRDWEYRLVAESTESTRICNNSSLPPPPHSLRLHCLVKQQSLSFIHCIFF